MRLGRRHEGLRAKRHPTVVASGQLQPSDVAVDDTSMYWIISLGGTDKTGAVMKLTPK
jgi:hypothetical protein